MKNLLDQKTAAFLNWAQKEFPGKKIELSKRHDDCVFEINGRMEKIGPSPDEIQAQVEELRSFVLNADFPVPSVIGVNVPDIEMILCANFPADKADHLIAILNYVTSMDAIHKSWRYAWNKQPIEDNRAEYWNTDASYMVLAGTERDRKIADILEAELRELFKKTPEILIPYISQQRWYSENYARGGAYYLSEIGGIELILPHGPQVFYCYRIA